MPNDISRPMAGSCDEFARQLELGVTPEELLALRHQLRTLFRQFEVDTQDVATLPSSDEETLKEVLTGKANVVCDCLAVGPIETPAGTPTSLKEIAEHFASRIVCESVFVEFQEALVKATAESAVASQKIVENKRQIEHLRHVEPLLLDFESLLNALSAPLANQ